MSIDIEGLNRERMKYRSWPEDMTVKELKEIMEQEKSFFEEWENLGYYGQQEEINSILGKEDLFVKQMVKKEKEIMRNREFLNREKINRFSLMDI